MNGSKHRLAGITFALAICMAAARYITYEGGNAPLAALSTLLRPDGILIGSALALLLADPIRGLLDFLRRRDVALAAVALIAAAMCTFRGARPELYQGGLLFVNLATAVLVGHVALTRTSFIKRTMATQPLPAIGRISYGLYLFHVPVLYLVFNNPPTRNGIVAAGAMFALTFAIAGVSFLLIEAPILTLKKRFSSVTTLKERDERALVRSR
jgi:peptidoglycan/LPS O-acetylase OafA/YrhL